MAFFRCTARGRLPGDIWQMGFVVEHDGDVADVAQTVAGQFQTMLTAPLLADFNNSVFFDDLVASELAVGSGVVVNSSVSPINKVGSASVSMPPPQCSMCVTILPVTGTSKGRFYMPVMNSGVLTTAGRIGTSKVGAWADAWHGFFSALGGASEPARLGIWRTGPNTFSAAKGISIGDVWDTQRRRRNKLIETRTERLVL